MTLPEATGRALKARTANPVKRSICSLCVEYAHESISVKKGYGTMQTLTPYGDNFIPVIRMEDEPLHTPDKPFCWDRNCGCHNDHTLYLEVRQFVTEGLMTPDEAVMFMAGRTV